MSFEFKYAIYAIFFLIPVGIGIVCILGMRKKQAIVTALGLWQDRFRVRIKVFLAVLGTLLIVLALMGPQRQEGSVSVPSQGVSVYVLMDTSKSMLAQDVAPSRIEMAKSIVEQIVDQLDGDRIGLIPFASSAYIQMPLTDDYDLADMFIDVIDTDMMSGGGTDMDQAINLAAQSLDESTDGEKVLLILSDGEEQDDISDSTWQTIQDDQLKIYAIGVGTTDGDVIPIYGDDGTTVTGYKKDDDGQTVITKLEEEVLQKLASESGGAYYRASVSGDEIPSILQAWNSLDQTTQRSKEIKQYKQYFQYLLLPGMLLLILSIGIPERRRATT